MSEILAHAATDGAGRITAELTLGRSTLVFTTYSDDTENGVFLLEEAEESFVAILEALADKVDEADA